MGYEVEYRGEIRCDPPLTAPERRWLRGFGDLRHHAPGDVNAVAQGMPGYWCPWAPTPDGHLSLPEWPTKEHMPGEWLRWLADSVWCGDRAVADPTLVGATRQHRLRGVVDAVGRASGDEWRLVADGQTMTVERRRMPCVSCWLNCRELCAPGAAYRFTHPSPMANMALGDLTPELEDELFEADEERCLGSGYQPLESVVAVAWPPPPGSAPPVPPFQQRLAALFASTDLEEGKFQARTRL